MIIKIKSKTEELPLNHIQSPKRVQALNDTITFNFTTLNHKNNPGFRLVQNENIVELDGHEYRIKQLSKRPKYTNVKAVHLYSDLIGTRREIALTGQYTLQQCINFLFAGTGWTVTTDLNKSLVIKEFGKDNVVRLMNSLCDLFAVEFEILPNKRISIKERLSGDRGALYRYAYNIGTIGEEFDSTALRTRITGFYGENGEAVTYTSPLAEIYGVIEADSVTDESVVSSAEMLDLIKAELEDTIKYSLDIKAVDTAARELGEDVRVIYEEMDLNLSGRVLKIEEELVLVNNEYKLVPTVITLGNYSREGYVDKVIGEIDKSRNEYRSRFEVTNDRITMEVEQIGVSIASLEIRADSIESSVTDLNNNLSSRITQTAAEIRSEVTNLDKKISSSISQTASQIRSEVQAEVSTINGNITTINSNISSLTQTASQIQSTVSSQTTQISSIGQRVSSAESTITQHANLISSKVSQDNFNGSTIVSLIEQAPSYVSISASKINLTGAVMVNGSISGATNISVTNSVKVGNTITLGDTSSSATKSVIFNGYARIDSNWNEISLSAANIDFSQASSITWGTNEPKAKFG